MPISNSTYLFSLVKSMTKADKRNFKLYAKRVQADNDMMFLQLFDVLDKMKEIDDHLLMSKLELVDKTQLSNLKRHLYKQILKSLRMISTTRIKSIEIREHIDYAHVLYSKGLFRQSLKILQRAKKSATKEELDILQLEIIEFQKLIESRHITNTGPVKNEALLSEASDLSSRVKHSVEMSNLSILLHGYYIRNSHVKNDEQREKVIQLYKKGMEGIDPSRMGLVERIYMYQCQVWYFYILLDYKKCYEAALNWIQVFDEAPEMKMLDKDLYMRGYHYLLIAAFNAKKEDLLIKHKNELEEFRKRNYAKFNENSKIFSFMYVHWARLNAHFLSGTFEEGVKEIPRTLRRIKKHKDRMAPHRVMVFYYKIAWMYLGDGNPGKAVNYINLIINDTIEDFREDIQSYSRLLYLMAHYDMDNIELLPYLVRTVDAFFKKTDTSNQLQTRSLQFFKKIHTLPVADRHGHLVEFKNDLQKIKEDPYEARAFLYLDMLDWVSSRVEKKSTLSGML